MAQETIDQAAKDKEGVRERTQRVADLVIEELGEITTLPNTVVKGVLRTADGGTLTVHRAANGQVTGVNLGYGIEGDAGSSTRAVNIADLGETRPLVSRVSYGRDGVTRRTDIDMSGKGHTGSKSEWRTDRSKGGDKDYELRSNEIGEEVEDVLSKVEAAAGIANTAGR